MNRLFIVIGMLALFVFANVQCDRCEKTEKVSEPEVNDEGYVRGERDTPSRPSIPPSSKADDLDLKWPSTEDK